MSKLCLVVCRCHIYNFFSGKNLNNIKKFPFNIFSSLCLPLSCTSICLCYYTLDQVRFHLTSVVSQQSRWWIKHICCLPEGAMPCLIANISCCYPVQLPDQPFFQECIQLPLPFLPDSVSRVLRQHNKWKFNLLSALRSQIWIYCHNASPTSRLTKNRPLRQKHLL